MTKKEKQDSPKRNAAPNPIHEPDPKSLKDNPDGETICSPYFSTGCVNEDTDVSALNQEGNENENN